MACIRRGPWREARPRSAAGLFFTNTSEHADGELPRGRAALGGGLLRSDRAPLSAAADGVLRGKHATNPKRTGGNSALGPTEATSARGSSARGTGGRRRSFRTRRHDDPGLASERWLGSAPFLVENDSADIKSRFACVWLGLGRSQERSSYFRDLLFILYIFSYWSYFFGPLSSSWPQTSCKHLLQKVAQTQQTLTSLLSEVGRLEVTFAQKSRLKVVRF